MISSQKWLTRLISVFCSVSESFCQGFCWRLMTSSTASLKSPRMVSAAMSSVAVAAVPFPLDIFPSSLLGEVSPASGRDPALCARRLLIVDRWPFRLVVELGAEFVGKRKGTPRCEWSGPVALGIGARGLLGHRRQREDRAAAVEESLECLGLAVRRRLAQRRHVNAQHLRPEPLDLGNAPVVPAMAKDLDAGPSLCRSVDVDRCPVHRFTRSKQGELARQPIPQPDLGARDRPLNGELLLVEPSSDGR